MIDYSMTATWLCLAIFFIILFCLDLGIYNKKLYSLKIALLIAALLILIKVFASPSIFQSDVRSAIAVVGILCSGAFIGYAVSGKQTIPHGPKNGTDAEKISLAAITWRQARRIVAFVVGVTVLCVGILMIVLPGPAFIFIPLGLVILGKEFLWARRLLAYLKERGSSLVNKVKSSGKDSLN